MNKNIEIILKVYVTLFFLFFSINTYSQNFVQKNIDSLKKISATNDNDIELIGIYTQITTLYIDKNRDSALYFAELAQILADKSGNELQKAKILNLKADLYRRHNSYQESIKIDERALEIAVENNDSLLMCDIYNDIGVTYRRLDDDAEAIKYHLWALEIAKNIGDSTNWAKSLNSIGIIYFGQERYADSEKHYREALKIETLRNNLMGVAINYNNLAEIYQKRKEFDKAVKYYKHSIEVNFKNNDSLGIAICYNDMGYTYLLMEDYIEAGFYALKAYDYFKANKRPRELAYSQLNIGKISIAAKKYARALKYLKECEKIASDYEFRSIKQQCYMSLSETYEKIGYLSLALKYYKQSYEEYLTIHKDQTSMISAELEAKYQIKNIRNENELLHEKDKIKDNIIFRQRVISGVISLLVVLLVVAFFFLFRSRRKIRNQKILIERKHIELLEGNNEIIAQKEKIDEQNETLNLQKNELIAANKSKDLFLSIIAHDLRNPFNAFLSLSGILLEDFHSLKDEEKIEMIALINESAGNAYRLLENLLSWAKSQTGAIETQKEVFELSNAAEEVLENEKIKLINKNIEIFYNIPNSMEVYADKNMIMTIIRNLVSNAIKFTNRGGTIKLFAENKGEMVQITISDTGIGIKEESLREIFDIDSGFKRKGTESEKGSGLGLILCKDFVEKNDGEMFVKSKEGVGSSFIFTIPTLPQ